MRLLYFISLVSCVSCLNIVFYLTAMGKSHLDFTDSLIDALVDRGHTVDFIIARFNSMVTSNGSSKADRIYSFGFKDSPWSKSPHLLDPFANIIPKLNSYHAFLSISNEICEMAFTSDGPTEFISQRKYDMAIASDYDFCALALFKKAGVPVTASFNSMPLLPLQCIIQGLPSPASISHSLMEVEDVSTFTGRFWNLARWTSLNYVQFPAFIDAHTNIIHRAYGDDFADGRQLYESVDVVFINANEILERPRPVSHKIKYIGGINLRKPKALNEKIDKILSSSSKGTVIISFGTQVPSEKFPKHVRSAFVNAFRQFPDFTFVWKYELQEGDEKLFSSAKNLHTLSWLPQTDLLYDKRVVGFVSHVGLNSYVEASHAGVPIIAIPLFADQKHNAISGESIGTTYILDKTNITVDTVVEALRAVLYEPRYRENARRISKMLVEKPNKPTKIFVDWVEFAAANPNLHSILNLPGSRLSPIEYYSIDIIITLLSVIIIIAYITYKIISRIIHSFSRSSKRREKVE